MREELLPNLAAYYNPAIRDALLRLSESAAADSDFLRIVAESEQSAVSIRSSNDSISLELAALNALHPAIRRRVVRLAIETVKGNLANVDFQAVESAVLASAKGLRFGWTIPGTQVRILCDGKSLTILRAEAAASPLPFEMVLNVSGTTEIPDGMIAAEELTDVNSADFAGPDCCVLDADAIQGMIRVRNRRPGDRIQPLGMSGTKKVQDILADAKIPADQRDRIPILSDDAGPLWVAGHRISERVKVTAKTRRILRIRYEKDPDTGSE